jgi:DNA replication protein DnaC
MNAKPPGNEARSAPAESAAIVSVEEQREFFLQERLRRSRIPPKFLAKTFESFDTRGSKERRDILAMARDYVASFGRQDAESHSRPGAVLHGTNGSGKTHMLVAILRELIAVGQEVRFYGVPALLSEIKASYNQESETTESDLLEEFTSVDVLALDDLGAEKSTDWVLDRLYLIINDRYENNRATLITTNHEWPGDLDRYVQRRIISRLAEMCQIIGPFPNEDWRLKSAGMARRMT